MSETHRVPGLLRDGYDVDVFLANYSLAIGDIPMARSISMTATQHIQTDPTLERSRRDELLGVFLKIVKRCIRARNDDMTKSESDRD
jgi:hypothetical protein